MLLMAPGNDFTTFLSRWVGLEHLVTDKTGLKGLFPRHEQRRGLVEPFARSV
jgi:hypothetical protein